MDTPPLASIIDAMPRRARSTPSPAAVLAATVLLGAVALTGCAGPAADGPVEPIIMTEADGVLRGPDEGASPVRPPDPAPAGEASQPPASEWDVPRGGEPTTTPSPPEPDDDDDLPPPPPPAEVDEDEEAEDSDGRDDEDDDPDTEEDDRADEVDDPDTDDEDDDGPDDD